MMSNSNPHDRPNTTIPSNSSNSETSPTSPANNTPGQDWRFDIDFRLNPNWLSNPDPTVGVPVPLPLSMLSDWFRNIQRPLTSDSQPARVVQNSPTSTSAPHEFGNMRVNDTQIPTGENQPRQLPQNDSHVQFSRGGRIMGRRDQTVVTTSGNDHNNDYPPPSPSNSTGRSTAPIVIDVAENEDDDWNAAPAPPPPPNNREDETPSESTDRIPPEAGTFLALAERYFPFIVILLFKGILDHASGLTVFLGLVVTFGHANTLLRREVTKQGKRSLPLLLMIMMNLVICTFCVYYIFESERLYPALVALSTDLPLTTVQSLMWVLLVTDFVAKFITVMIKCLVVMIPEEVLPFQKRGKHYMFIEATSQLYRCFLPIHPWLQYLFGSYEGSFQVFGLFLCLFYVICKAVDVSQRILAWKVALKKFLQPVHYGTVPSLDELNEQFCPICHDGFTCPTKLSCGHIFCEDCVSNWLDRGERSCPMCRARVVDDTSWRDGTTSQFVQSF